MIQLSKVTFETNKQDLKIVGSSGDTEYLLAQYQKPASGILKWVVFSPRRKRGCLGRKFGSYVSCPRIVEESII